MDHLDSFNERNLRRILEEAMNIALEYDSEFCSFDHMILAALKLISNDKNYSEFNKEFKTDEIIKDIEKSISKNSRRKGALFPKFTNYSVDMISEKLKKLNSQGKKYFDYCDLFHLILNEDETNSAISKYIIFSKVDEDKFFESLEKIREKNLLNKESLDTEELESFIEQHCVNLNKLASQDKIDPLIGREKEIFLIAKVLCRRVKNNVVLIGDPGVGKTAIVEGLARKIVENDIYLPLKNAVVYSLSVTSLMAGTRYRGDLEEKIRKILDSIVKLSKTKNILPVVFIDEIHMIVGAGSTSDNRSIDIANMLKPLLQKGEIKIIGSTTFEEYSKFLEKDKALERRFQKVVVEEASEKDAIEIIKGLKKYYETFHNVEYSEEAIELAVKLSKKFIHHSFLPDKAIDVIDNVAAKLKLLANDNEKIKIQKSDIIEEISDIAKVPREKLMVDENSAENNLKNMADKLKEIIYGQDKSIDEIVSTILVARAGLRDPEKPEAAFLINGPTGTGKTELCKQIAKILNMNFARLDMSEFMEKHSSSKLIGAPPGYVGYEDSNGKLISIIDKNPNSVILFDEVEKAHPDVINILLQVLDYGKLTNNHNKTVKFNNCIIFMTANLGSSDIDKKSIGFIDDDKRDPQNNEMNKFFSPEFRNRLDGIIIFNKLTKEISVKIINKFISELRENFLREKNIDIEIDENAIDYLLEKGFDDKMGARPLSRVIDKEIKYKLAPEILFGRLKKGGTVKITTENNKISLEIKGNGDEK